MSTPFLLLAKAGGADEAAENTCEAIAQSLALACPTGVRLGIEVDVRLSADGVPVVIHDATLERTTNGVGLVRARSAAELGALHAGPHAERVPLLAQVLELAQGRELVVEAHEADLELAAALVKLLRAMPSSTRRGVMVASEHDAFVHAVRSLAPELRTAATAREGWRKLLLERARLDVWAPRGHTWIVPVSHRGLRVVTQRFVQSAARAGDPVWSYVVNDAIQLQRQRVLGVAGCFCTRPAELLRALGTPAA